jgi:transketolase C-terminal domain/subunit
MGWYVKDDARGRESLVRFEVSADPKGARFVVIHSGLADEDSATHHTIGWTSLLRKLERLAV